MDLCGRDMLGIAIAVVMNHGSDGIVLIVTHNIKSWHPVEFNAVLSVLVSDFVLAKNPTWVDFEVLLRIPDADLPYHLRGVLEHHGAEAIGGHYTFTYDLRTTSGITVTITAALSQFLQSTCWLLKHMCCL